MKHGSWYEKEFDLDPLIALILRWRWCRLSGMKEISFKKVDENHAELKQFKKITIEIKWKENQNPSARQGSGPVAGLKQFYKLALFWARVINLTTAPYILLPFF